MEKDKLIVEALGECWHEWKEQDRGPKGFYRYSYYKCDKCSHSSNNPWQYGLTTWEGFGWAWERAQKMEWWGNFIADVGMVTPDDANQDEDWDGLKILNIINPTSFRDALFDFLKERGNRIL